MIRDRRKIPVNEGAGLDESQNDSVMKSFFEERISDRDYAEGRNRFRSYDLETKEELFYLRKLADQMDISRVPHLKGRLKLEVPAIEKQDRLKAYMA